MDSLNIKYSNYEDYFQRVNNSYKPYEFQTSVISSILSGKNVILQAPTGSGKTLSAIMPYIIAMEKGINFPRRLIYSVPLRSLANEFVGDIRKDIRNFRKKDGKSFDVTIQTGERPDDEHFDNGDIVITTYDQSLSSILCIPVGLSRRQANVNAGAIASSYLVFDEIHLYEMERALATMITILRWLGKYSRFLLMTATLTDSLKKDIKSFVGGDIEIIEVSEDEIKSIQSQRDKNRIIKVESSSLTSEIVINCHKGGRTIVVCNTVKKSQELYKGVKDLLPKKEVILLHSRFLSKDREEKEKRIDKLFGKDSRKEKMEAILIATQVVEVGLDISCDTMLIEVAEVPSVIQRMGRCARFEGEDGEVFVYDVDKEDGKKHYLPYNDSLCESTLSNLKDYNGKNLSYSDTLTLVNSVMGEYDERSFTRGVEHRQTEIFDRAIQLMNRYDRQGYSELIRDISNVNILICNDSKISNENFKPYSYIPFSIDRRIVKQFLEKAYKLKEIDESIRDEWIAKEVIEEIRDEEGKKYRFDVLVDTAPSDLLIINPKFASYDSEVGLILCPEGGCEDRSYIFEKDKCKDKSDRGEYKKELYYEHIEMCINESKKYREDVSWLYDQLAEDLGFSDVKDALIDLMLFAHDLGKLDRDWQNAHERDEGEYIAHGVRLKTSPNHSSVGAHILGKTLPDYLKERNIENFVRIYRPLMASIAKHHTVDVSEFRRYSISSDGVDYLRKKSDEKFRWFLDSIKGGLLSSDKIYTASIIELGNDKDMLLLYFIFSRILRLSDQKATNEITNRR